LSRLSAQLVDLLWRASLLAALLVAGVLVRPTRAEASALFEAQCGLGEAAIPELWLKVSLNGGYTEPEAATLATPCDAVPAGEEACSKLPALRPLGEREEIELARDVLPGYVPASLDGAPQRLPTPWRSGSACWDSGSPDKCQAAPPMPTPLELQASHAHAVVADFVLPSASLRGAALARPRAPSARVMGRLLGPHEGFERTLFQPPKG
jgi:hypothetical protein